MQRKMDVQGSPDAKKPCKGILKTSSSFDKHCGASHRKSAKFDELNVLQTYHPPDKDYGHMKIEEPKTPYNYVDPDLSFSDQLDAELLAEKLKVAANSRTSSNDDEYDTSSEEEEEETEEQRARRLEFEKRRKAHYREFEAVKLARKLIEEEEDDDEEDESKNNESNKNVKDEDKDSTKGKMETDIIKEDGQNTSPSPSSSKH